MPSGAELFIAAARRLGINEIFTLVGDHLNEVLLEASRSGMRIIDFRHESGALHAADCWARLRRGVALSMVTGGPGHTNSLSGIATAYLAASPLVAVSGAVSTQAEQRALFQEIDQVGMAAPVAKWAGRPPSTAHIPLYLRRACAEAVAGRMGPVHLTIPVDLFAGRCDAPLTAPDPPARSAPAPDPGDVERALALLRSAARPVVIAGSGLWWSDAGDEMMAFLRKTRLPYYSLAMARGVITDFWRYSMGYADPALNQAVMKAFPEADLCLVLGKRIDSRLALGGTRLFSPATRFIQVDIHPQELGRNRAVEVAICADLKATLRAFLEALGKESWKPRVQWIRRQRAWQQEWRAKLEAAASDTGSPLHPAAFFQAIRPHVLGVPLCWDGGDFAHWGRALVPALEAGGWLRLGPLATVGCALPNSVALQLASPGRKAVLFTGDGALGFYLGELDTLVRHHLPVVVVVGNDGGWGLERELQRAVTGGATVACELRRSRYDLVMQALGGEGETVERLDQAGPAIARALKSDKPYLVNVMTRGVRSPFTDWQLLGKKQ